MIERFLLSDALREFLVGEARRAYPRECCGLIEGVGERQVAQAEALHPTLNLAQGDDRFEIDPAEHVRLLRRLRGSGREIIGCYHSHPNGSAHPSPRDREGAFGGDFLWLIVGFRPCASGTEEIDIRVFALGSAGDREIPVVAASVA